ncbi:hypothetical protein [Mesorhizobium sp.]|uniref:hypothetical protein n=1 Tax=Mesorhizobium sp. TaxID=1871066 RepID=UPI000FE622EA|nr:hypothetical protein [Mesorhizobium sp.]RWD36106.1 MAG: hypothetical protein EOS33_05495 [Mesorhizobium sp.]
MSLDGCEERSVTSRLVAKLREPTNGGELVFITHEGWKLLPYVGKLDWTLIVDEAPAIHSSFDPLIDDDLRQLINQAVFLPSPYEGLKCFSVSKSPERVLTSDKHTVNGSKIHKLAWEAFSKKALVLVPDTSVEALQSPDSEGRKFQAFSLLTPEVVKPFKSVLMLSANFESTLPFHLWSRHGARFVEDKELASRLRFQKHDGRRATISYVIEADWSKQIQDREVGDGSGCTIHARVVEKVSEFFGTDQFLWVANNRFGDGLFAANENATRLPNVSHGLNEYQKFNNVVFLSALNPSPPEFSYFKKLGLTEKQAKAARFHEAVYQGIMRCSLRSQDDPRPVQIVVMDRATATYLHQLLPGSIVQKLDWIPADATNRKQAGRPKEHVDATARKRASRSRQKTIKAHDGFVTRADALVLSDHFASNGSHEIPIESIGENVTKWFWGMQFQSITAAVADDVFWFETLSEFVDDLRRLAGQRVATKERCRLIGPAYYNREKAAETDRGNANIEFLRGIWLDNDGGGISPVDVSDLFPELKMVIFNSFSSTEAKPRFRVFIPTTTVFSVHTHDTIMRGIWNRLHKAGFEADRVSEAVDGRRFHGFDWSKRPATSLFYLPCQAADPAGNIFLEFLSGERRPLEPIGWIKKYHREPETLTERAVDDWSDASVDWAKLDAATAAWRNAPKTPGNGNRDFFKLGLSLKAAGLSQSGIEAQLWEEAIFARSPTKRRRQIPSVIRSLKIYKVGQSGKKAA